MTLTRTCPLSAPHRFHFAALTSTIVVIFCAHRFEVTFVNAADSVAHTSLVLTSSRLRVTNVYAADGVVFITRVLITHHVKRPHVSAANGVDSAVVMPLILVIAWLGDSFVRVL
ncbi:MAG TPA: hypothetical protein VGZ68_05150 [Acidimicrobiales bacterium]|nr:hypothetical protein [Acidimicrobiales bacterium]